MAWIVRVWLGPYSTPVGRSTFSDRTAAATRLMLSPRVASWSGSSWMRTAYLPEPNTETCATPSTIESRWAMVVSPYSSSCWSGSTFEVSAIMRIGADAGFCLRYEGGMIPGGRLTSVWEIAAFTSCAAASTLRSSANCSVICVEPNELLEVMLSMPAIAEKAFSSGVATVAAMVSGLAPERLALTLIVG